MVADWLNHDLASFLPNYLGTDHWFSLINIALFVGKGKV